MLREAIEYVRNLADEASDSKQARIVSGIPGDGTAVVIEHGGKLIDRPVPPALRNHNVDSVADLIAAANRWKGAGGNVVWINGKSVVLVIDDADRRAKVTMPLVESAVFQRIKKLAQQPCVDQPTLIRLLRVELRHVIRAAELLTAVRKIKFRSAQSGHSDIQHGNESLGNQIEAEVTGADAIPDSLVVETNLFSNPGLDENKTGIGLDLEIDVKQQKFLLRPIPDEIEKVTAAELALIRAEIETALGDVPIFFGTP
jgi:hypothetical protein